LRSSRDEWLAAVLDALTDSSFGGPVAHLAGADAFVALAALLDALALHDLPAAALLDALTSILQLLAGDRVPLGLEHGALALQALAATEISFAALLFARAAKLLTLAFALLANAAHLLGLAGALDSFARPMLRGRLCTRL
jgi:hypothetical protein